MVIEYSIASRKVISVSNVKVNRVEYHTPEISLETWKIIIQSGTWLNNWKGNQRNDLIKSIKACDCADPITSLELPLPMETED
jgi:hypothetical protein